MNRLSLKETEQQHKRLRKKEWDAKRLMRRWFFLTWILVLNVFKGFNAHKYF